MELRNLKTFQVVAECLNFTKAAEILNFTQPTVTAQIQSLERELNQLLFFRVGKKNHLTPAGKLLKKYTDQLFMIADEMETAFLELGKPHGYLKIAASEYYCTNFFPLVISEFLKTFPDVHINLVSCNSDEVIKGIESNTYDLGVIVGEISKNDLKNIVLDEEELLLVAGKNAMKEFQIDELITELPFIRYRIEGNYKGFINQYLHQADLHPKKIIEFGSEEAIKRAILKGTGYGVLSSNLIKKEIKNGELIPIPLTDQKFHFKTSLIYLKKKEEKAILKSFSEVIEELWTKAVEK
ncbi:LysR family transcriptional regulator [Siminovitchia fortis]|uniref:LysR family transcriptional regulator n=1 Tax=Siminovitchia fortis TaxID=254758 RepID=A0A443IMG6_9BACI|nr:LysR family transcriptional regulator [Siminovitchia fortis]RWR06941.1 LysR family transcriptional regulator [Siminovitchia fortis]WHY82101.1 LysR family transcriptional regulator [Siminovitchia fortis]